jgi:hypothetical protein
MLYSNIRASLQKDALPCPANILHASHQTAPGVPQQTQTLLVHHQLIEVALGLALLLAGLLLGEFDGDS